jgi:hypothetical protein
MRAVNRFLNPVMNVMCTTSHMSHAILPESLTPCMPMIALRRSRAAILPKSRYFQGRGSAFLRVTLITWGEMETRLKRNLGNARKAIAVHDVTEHEHFRVAGERTVRFYLDRPARSHSASGVR